MKLSKGLVAASATPIILSILSRGDSYGYEIIEEVRKASDGELEWADGMLYPILHRLEKNKLIKSYWNTTGSGRKRKYYKISTKGLEALAEQCESWSRIQALLQKLQGNKPCLS